MPILGNSKDIKQGIGCAPIVGPRVGPGRTDYSRLPKTASEALAVLGYTPVALWTFQETGTPVDDKVGTADLANQGSGPTYRVDTPLAGIFGVSQADNTSNRLTLTSSNTALDPGSESWFLLGVARLGDSASGNRDFLGKYLNDGLLLQHRPGDNYFRGWFVQSGGTPQRTVDLSDECLGDYAAFIYGADRVSGQFYLSVKTRGTIYHGQVAEGTFGSITNAQYFSLAARGTASFEHDMLWLGYFEGFAVYPRRTEILGKIWCG